MLPTLPVFFIVASELLIFLVVGYYLISLRKKAKQLHEKENAIDTNYHHVVDHALSKERKIIDDATTEADQIITGAQYLTRSSHEEVDTAIKDMILDIQKEGQTIAKEFTTEYTTSLKKMSTDSLSEFQTIMSDLQLDLKKQIKAFHESLLPEVEKELDTYKQTRLKEIDQTVTGIVQKASQEIFNKSLSLSDHEAAVMQALENAKKEGVFD